MTTDPQTLDDTMPTILSEKAEPAPEVAPERAAHLRNLGQVKKNFADMLNCKFKPGTAPHLD